MRVYRTIRELNPNVNLKYENIKLSKISLPNTVLWCNQTTKVDLLLQTVAWYQCTRYLEQLVLLALLSTTR